MQIRRILLFFIFLLAVHWLVIPPGFTAGEDAEKNLPVLMEGIPEAQFQILSPVGAQMKTTTEAREQLRMEAGKLQADAVIYVKCEEGGVRRDGLTWYRESAYCRGMAIRYAK